MKKIHLLLALLVIAVSTTYAQSKSQVKSLKMTSETLGVEREYSIYLPAGYEESGKTYPVLYLLHGAWGDHNDWPKAGNMRTITDQAIECGMSSDMIIVMPDARGVDENLAGKNMGYFNVPEWPYEDYFFQEFVPFIDKTYRTRADKKSRAIAGLSMGGGGTAVYAQHHPELFSSACSLSGLVGLADSCLASQLDPAFEKVARETNPTEFVRNATDQQVEALRTVRWYVDCGDDDYLYEGNITLYLAMRERKIPLQYRMRDGAHTWTYWQTALPTVLQFCSIGFAQ